GPAVQAQGPAQRLGKAGLQVRGAEKGQGGVRLVKEEAIVIPKARVERLRARGPEKAKDRAAAPGKVRGAGPGKGEEQAPEKARGLDRVREKVPARGKALTAFKKVRGRIVHLKTRAADKGKVRGGRGKAPEKEMGTVPVIAAAVPAGRAEGVTMMPAGGEQGKGVPNKLARKKRLRASQPRNRQSQNIWRRLKKKPNNLKA
ncbi:MAG TPA: hypothetical protein PKU74_01440, partial [Candidatus Omnitrophota bacterium]|nr:hypothetical protein [Candidatus Omnitrophota bacterium]